VLDTTRVTDVLDFRPRDDFETVLGEEVAWLRDHLSCTPRAPTDAGDAVTRP
jgi:hypothetical protein